MPDLTAQASLLRSGAFRFTGDLNFVPRVVVFSRAVDMAVVPTPVETVTYDDPYSGVGSHTDVKVGQTILFYYQNTNLLKGIARVAYGGATSATIEVNELSRGTLWLEDGDRFDVVEEYDLWDMLVSATSDFNKDSRRAYVDEGDNPPPVANSGGPVVGTVDPDTGELLVDFPGDTSFRVDPDEGVLVHDWQFGDDATPTDSTDESPSGVSIPEGFRFVSHTVEDSNGKTDVQYVPVWANGPNYPPLKVRLRQRHYSALGWSATFEVPVDSAALSVLHDRAFVVYSETEQRGRTVGSFGAAVSGRSHIKFAGYLDRTTIRMNADETVISFDAISPLALMEKTGALPQLLVRGGSGWMNVKELNFWRALWYILYWGSTAKLSHDFLWPDGQAYAYERLEIADDTSLLGQLRDIAGSIKVDVTCDMLGRILLVRNPNYLSIPEREGRTIAYNFGLADLISAEFDMEHRLRYKFVRGEALTAAATVAEQQAVYADAPGPAPGPGNQVATLSRQVVINPVELIRRTDNELAFLNGTYLDPNTRAITKVPKDVLVGLPDSYDVFDPALREYVTFALDTGRYVYDDSTRWLIDELSITYNDDGGKDIAAIVSHETHGGGGTLFIPPVAPPSELPGFDLTNPFDGGFAPLPGLSGTTADIGMLGLDGILYTNDFTSSSPTWQFEDWSAFHPTNNPDGLNLLNAGEIVCGIVQKPGEPRTFVLATITHVRVFKDVLNGTHETLSYPLRSTVSGQIARLRRRVQIERGNPNICYVVTQYTDGLWSEGFINDVPITPVQIGGSVDASAAPALFVDQNNPLIAYLIAHDGSIWRWYKTADGGQSWNITSDYAWDNTRPIGSAERSFGNPSRIFVAAQTGPFPDAYQESLRRATASGVDVIRSDGAGWKARSVATYDSDPNVLLFVSSAPTTFSNYNRSIVKSLDGGNSWTTILASEAMCCIGNTTTFISSSAVIGGDGSVFLWLTHGDSAGVYFHPNIYTLTDFSQMQDKTGSGYVFTGSSTPYGLVGL